MVIPREHGAWGMLLVPLTTGAIVAAGAGANFRALGLFLVSALALFWMRTPLEAWLGTTAIKAQSPSERAAVIRASLGLAFVAAAAVAAQFVMGLASGLLQIGAIAAAAFALQAFVKRFGRAGRMPAQVIGAIGLTSTSAGAYFVSIGKLDHVAFALWLANWLFAGDQIHFVQVRIRGSRLADAPAKVRQGYGFLGGQVLLLLVIGFLTRMGVFPKLTVLAFVPALLRGFAWFVRGAQPLDVHKLGFSELAHSLVFGGLLAVAFLV